MNLTAVLWGFLGFLFGYLAGTFWGVKQKPPAKKATTRKTAAAPPKKRSRWGGEQWIGPVVLLLAVLMGVQYMYQINQDRRTSACQTQFNQAFAKQLTIRSELASQAQANVDKIILSVGKMIAPSSAKNPTGKERERLAAEYRKLFTDFARESAEIQRKRNNTPLPKLPTDGCVDGGNPIVESTVLAEERTRVRVLEAQLDASREAILGQMPDAMRQASVGKTHATPVREVIVREPSRTQEPKRIEPNDKSIVVNVPKTEPPVIVTPPSVAPEPPNAEQVCTLNLLGICVDL
jgi:hypothetical protein